MRISKNRNLLQIFNDRITRTSTINGKNWTTVNNTLTGAITSTSPMGKTITVTYDPVTILTRRIDIPGLHPRLYTYDTKGRPSGVSIGTRSTTFTYTGKGFIDTVTLPDTKVIRYTYDDMGRIKTKTLPGNIVISFDYDNNGNLKTITNPKAVLTTFDYTGVNVRKTMAMPLSGIYLYTYDTEKNVKSITFPSGKQRINTYTNGLLASTVTPEGMTAYTYTGCWT